MEKAKWFVIALCTLTLVVMRPKVSTAEWFADLCFGEASTQSADVNVDISSSSLGFVRQYTTTKKGDFDDSFTFGGRVGYYFESLPWAGFALDLSYFQADAKNVDNDIVPISLLFMLRKLLLSHRIQPVLFIFSMISNISRRLTHFPTGSCSSRKERTGMR